MLWPTHGNEVPGCKLRAKSFRRRSLLGLYVRNLAAMKEGAAESAAARNEAYALALQEHAATDAAIAHAVGAASNDAGASSDGEGDGDLGTNYNSTEGDCLALQAEAHGGRHGCTTAGYTGAGLTANDCQPPSGAGYAGHGGLQAPSLPLPPLQLQHAQPPAWELPMEEPRMHRCESWHSAAHLLQPKQEHQGEATFMGAPEHGAWPLSWDGSLAGAGGSAGGFAGAGPSGSRAAAAALAAGGSAWGSGGGGTEWAVEGAEHGRGGAEALDGMQTDYGARAFSAADSYPQGADAFSLDQAWAPPQPAGGWAGGGAAASPEHARTTRGSWPLPGGPVGRTPHGGRRAEHPSLNDHTAHPAAWQQEAPQPFGLPSASWQRRSLPPQPRSRESPTALMQAAASPSMADAGGRGLQRWPGGSAGLQPLRASSADGWDDHALWLPPDISPAAEQGGWDSQGLGPRQTLQDRFSHLRKKEAAAAAGSGAHQPCRGGQPCRSGQTFGGSMPPAAGQKSLSLRELCFPETWMPPPGPHWRHTAPPVPSKALGAGIGAAAAAFDGPTAEVLELLHGARMPPPPEYGLTTLFRYLNEKL
ncbi:hypothetical protein HYH03_016501 [Edaphochlamys debaryana]|uniref:Uncharacterized protein n=1 Tax=Edaphochlamys debaryana TaxID=47281 RepID=A0A835XJU1_9CHLO|nr:hypothetical protein HYH03_016501 [Edaphochlamys debaryana]|eukprot:KAG2484754.1 hypothetical protein HYH03_016501 [Edaphochlamys debaryana]